MGELQKSDLLRLLEKDKVYLTTKDKLRVNPRGKERHPTWRLSRRAQPTQCRFSDLKDFEISEHVPKNIQGWTGSLLHNTDINRTK